MEIYEEIGIFIGALHSSRASQNSSRSRSEIVIIDPDYVKSKISPERKERSSSKESIVQVHSSPSISRDTNNKPSSLWQRTSKTINQSSQKKLRRISDTGSLKEENLTKMNKETLSHYEEYKSITKIEDLRAKSSNERSSLKKSNDLPKTNKDSLSHYEEYKSTTKIEDLRPKIDDLRPKDSISEHSEVSSPESPSWLDKLTNDNKYGMHPPKDITKAFELPSTSSE
ncbi:hypothetical protein Anas_03876 [Armadillidium nasatum]|uniref:Uncharacterized protein n=1 Tax=Armadillidium nasatum TaxID=96803 RepID=A0A5N5STF4_9CRUS|nr:hypothetical protein Anas_03876 [Armadillidium nasatum]